MVPLATGLSDFEAKVLTARLGADGIIWQLRGVVDSVYPIGEIDVLVPDAELDDAMALLVGALDLDPDDPHELVDATAAAPANGWSWWVAALVLGATGLFFCARLFAVG